MFALALIACALGALAVLGGMPLALNATIAAAAVICGHIAHIGCKKANNSKGIKFALAGFVLGYVGLITSVVIPMIM
jgi:hypothetical protein